MNEKLFKNGWDIYEADKLDSLIELRKKIYEKTKKTFSISEENEEIGFNNFHKILSNLDETTLNEKKVSLIDEISKDENLVNLIYESLKSKITNLLGKDLLVQKTINVVIQKPGDQNPTIPHRDAPPNSFYEIVLWIPLVDCKDTKSMYLIDSEKTKKNLEALEKNPEDWNTFMKSINKDKVFPNIKFGNVILFLPYVYHGSDVNKTNETRFSLNIRFKGIFSPSGKKFPLQFFRIFKISDFTKNAINKSKEEFLF